MHSGVGLDPDELVDEEAKLDEFVLEERVVEGGVAVELELVVEFLEVDGERVEFGLDPELLLGEESVEEVLEEGDCEGGSVGVDVI